MLCYDVMAIPNGRVQISRAMAQLFFFLSLGARVLDKIPMKIMLDYNIIAADNMMVSNCLPSMVFHLHCYCDKDTNRDKQSLVTIGRFTCSVVTSIIERKI